MSGSKKRGLCPCCGESILMNFGGCLRKHMTPGDYSTCPGSYHQVTAAESPVAVAVAAERERCAVIAETWLALGYIERHTATSIAARIRSGQ